MAYLIHQIIAAQARLKPGAIAIRVKQDSLSYQALQNQIEKMHLVLGQLGLDRHERVGVYLAKGIEAVVSMFAVSQTGGVFVPINPLLKASQVEHIATDCRIKILITNSARFKALAPVLTKLIDLHTVILTDSENVEHIDNVSEQVNLLAWRQLQKADYPQPLPLNSKSISTDMAAIFYTSGSTGKPKGVVLSHLNLLTGARSVASYLANTADDKILALLPLSFDYGFSQLTTALLVGAEVVLHDYFLAQDVLRAIEKYQITGLAGVPPLWSQLCKLNWQNKGKSIRYFTNSGGALNQNLLKTLRENMKNAQPFLMYGLTEAFRSTFLDPERIDRKPTSMGQAIPNAEIIIVRSNGSECEIGEVGELVHIGPLVAQGYWNAPEQTALHFKPVPNKPAGIVSEQMAVFSGDMVKRDVDGDLFFIGRSDEMIKSSGYRISPMEIEECFYQHPKTIDAVALGVSHPELGQAILVVVAMQEVKDNTAALQAELRGHCHTQLANFMQPTEIIILSQLPKNTNGKLDRALLAHNYANFFRGNNE
ncbi:acyl-CoA ligase (AMP-forming), exosortase A system-associated [Thalassotalea sp. 42_200_T64]|nr:acyl-CoA ligase (AMP-forming), exosortase A system-associated [Thalassotalea sp. 42_200_T64]